MTTYVDSSALLKRYIDDPGSEVAEHFVLSDPVLVTSRVTLIEVRRNLMLHGPELRNAKQQLTADLEAMALVAVDVTVCRAAVQIAERLGVGSLDAIHLASAQRFGIPALPFVTFDLRQAQAAGSLGFAALGS